MQIILFFDLIGGRKLPLYARTPFSFVIIAGMSYGPFSKISCADPGICVIGGQGPDLFLVFSPQLILQFQRGSNCFIAGKTILSKAPEGVKHFQGGPTVGVRMLISTETHITCDFPRGSGPPSPPPPPHTHTLWTHT